MDCVGGQSLGGVLFCNKCLEPMNMSFRDRSVREVSAMEYIVQNDPFMRLRPGSWVLTLDLSIGKQAKAAAKATRVLLFKGFRKPKSVSTMSKEKRKEKGKAHSKSKRKMTDLQSGVLRRSCWLRLYNLRRGWRYGLFIFFFKSNALGPEVC